MPSSDNQYNLNTQHSISEGKKMFHMDIVRINKKMFVCTQIIRHDKTQNLVTIKHKVIKNKTLHMALNMSFLLHL